MAISAPQEAISYPARNFFPNRIQARDSVVQTRFHLQLEQEAINEEINFILAYVITIK